MVELLLLRSGEVVHAVPVGDAAIHVGRAPANELVVSDPTVSGHHLMVWRDSQAIWIKDLGSTNGTFINERRIRSVHPVRDGDKVRLGTSCILQVRAALPAHAADRSRGLVLEDLRAGTRFALTGDRFSIGSSPKADLRLAEGPELAAVLILHSNGEVRLGTDDAEGPLPVGEEFTVADRPFKVLEVDGGGATEVPAGERYPYKLSVTLEGPFGAEASLEDNVTHKAHKIESGNRAVLLFLLGRRFEEERQRGVPSDERGWCPDDEVMTGIWGRHGDENKLNVLLHRVRAELRTAGFDPWFIEKKQRFVRIRVSEVVIR